MKNIVLIGMSGVGKTAIGKNLAESMKKSFCDTDDLIIDREKLSVKDIFANKGELYFRDVEHQVINLVSEKENYIISTGGGVVLNKENIKALRKNGYIVLLMGKVETIVRNLNKSKVVRPLLQESQDLHKKVENLFMEREHLYLGSSDMIINVDNKSIEEISRQIMMEYERLISRNI